MFLGFVKKNAVILSLIAPSVCIADFDDSDMLTSLGEYQKEVREYVDGGMSIYQCLVKSDNLIEDCGAKQIDVSTMNEANRFDVAIYNKDPMSKLASIEVKSVNPLKFSDYESKTHKVCVSNVACEYLDPATKKYVRRAYDLMFVLSGGLDVTRHTISVGYRPAAEN